MAEAIIPGPIYTRIERKRKEYGNGLNGLNDETERATVGTVLTAVRPGCHVKITIEAQGEHGHKNARSIEEMREAVETVAHGIMASGIGK